MNTASRIDSVTPEAYPIGKVVENLVGRVIGRSEDGEYRYQVKPLRKTDEMFVFPSNCLAEAAAPASFKKGSYARAPGGIVYILDGGDSGYWVASVELNDERFFHPNELSSWSPLPGERVTESKTDCDDNSFIIGVIVTAGQRTSLVKWDDSAEPEVWRNTQLEPVWD